MSEEQWQSSPREAGWGRGLRGAGADGSRMLSVLSGVKAQSPRRGAE